MPQNRDIYFQRRLAEELAAAERATDAAAANIHRSLAIKYSTLADGGSAAGSADHAGETPQD
jgi:hypothetical protein